MNNENDKLEFLEGEGLPKLDGYVGEATFVPPDSNATAYYDIVTDAQYGIYTTESNEGKTKQYEKVKSTKEQQK